MSVAQLEEAAAALGPLTDAVVFLGAAALPLWISDPGAPPLRATADVDVVVVEVTSLSSYYDFEDRLRQAGFRDEGTVLGRFLFGRGDAQLDVIPADATVLGFENRWQRASLPDAVERMLPSGVTISCLPAPNLLATKLEAFASRGEGDYLGSPDFEDIVALMNGRPELVDELSSATSELRAYVGAEISRFIADPRAQYAVSAHLETSGDGPKRAAEVVLPRFQEVGKIGPGS